MIGNGRYWQASTCPGYVVSQLGTLATGTTILDWPQAGLYTFTAYGGAFTLSFTNAAGVFTPVQGPGPGNLYYGRCQCRGYLADNHYLVRLGRGGRRLDIGSRSGHQHHIDFARLSVRRFGPDFPGNLHHQLMTALRSTLTDPPCPAKRPACPSSACPFRPRGTSSASPMTSFTATSSSARRIPPPAPGRRRRLDVLRLKLHSRFNPALRFRHRARGNVAPGRPGLRDVHHRGRSLDSDTPKNRHADLQGKQDSESIFTEMRHRCLGTYS